MWYVYVIKSKNHSFLYVGSTKDLYRRLSEHNNGESKSTAPYKPYELKSYVAVQTEDQARKLERYFKSGSGKTILKKRILDDEDLPKTCRRQA